MGKKKSCCIQVAGSSSVWQEGWGTGQRWAPCCGDSACLVTWKKQLEGKDTARNRFEDRERFLRLFQDETDAEIYKEVAKYELEIPYEFSRKE